MTERTKNLGARLTQSGTRLKSICVAAITLVAAAALYTTVLIAQRQAVVQEQSNYNISWLASQSGLELARLEALVGASQIPDTGVTQRQVLTWYEIVRNRIQLLTHGDVLSAVRQAPELGTIIRDTANVVQQAGLLVARLDRPDTATELLRILLPLNPKITRLASQSYVMGTNSAWEHLHALARLQWIFAGLLACLIIGGFVLIALLSWHNRLLERAHANVQQLVEDLQQSSADLAEANERVQYAMGEAQLQNEILCARDRELHTQNSRFDAALNNMSQALCMTDAEGNVIECNVRFHELFGIPRNALLPGAAIDKVFHRISRSGRYDARMINAIKLEQETLAVSGRVGKFFQEDENGRALAVSQRPMEGGGWVATYEDISERRRAEAQISFLAHHDALTGLPNRLLFQEKMKAGLEFGEDFAVLCLDLDYFKEINDTLGHAAGDALLQAVAGRLRNCVRDTDLVARLGGDEFAILQFSSNLPDDAETLAHRVAETLKQPFQLEGQPAIVGASIGIALASPKYASAEVLLKCADVALYRAKSDGRCRHRFFQAEMDAELQERKAMELDLREALALNQLELVYQPQFELVGERISGFEALLRWRHPQRGMVPPALFIPIAEHIRLIGPISSWVLRKACRDALSWPEHVRIAVNLSPSQFYGDNLVEHVKSALDDTGLAAQRLELEITESTLLKNDNKVVVTLHQLRSLGVRIALDDFGTGYSSLSYLRSFPFDKIKVDQSFVRDINSRPDCLAIVRSIAGLARQLGITTTAEGVETSEQLAGVRDAGCTEVQGFFLGRPGSPGAASELFGTPVDAPERAAA